MESLTFKPVTADSYIRQLKNGGIVDQSLPPTNNTYTIAISVIAVISIFGCYYLFYQNYNLKNTIKQSVTHTDGIDPTTLAGVVQETDTNL